MRNRNFTRSSQLPYKTSTNLDEKIYNHINYNHFNPCGSVKSTGRQSFFQERDLVTTGIYYYPEHIAGKDKKFYWASARIERNKVIVSSDKIDAPVAVRYAWSDNPVCNLVNSEGLPAIPFN